MKKKTGSERRVNPRINHELPIKVAVNGYDFETATQNVSCTGAYCRVNKYVPPFTKVMVKLNLPAGSESGKSSCVECRGVIVRSEDDASGGFNIAIFFNHMSQEQCKKISHYVNRFLPVSCVSSTQ